MASAEARPAAPVPISERPSTDGLPTAVVRADAHEAARRLTSATRRDFALVVPAFNEAPMAAELVAELRRTWSEYGLEGEILLVDDRAGGRIENGELLLARQGVD